MEWIKFLADALADESLHFLLSALVGAWAFCSILIICYVLRLAWERSTRRRMPTVVGYFIITLSLLAMLSAALFSHAWLDRYSLWYTQPLDPPLQIETGNGLQLRITNWSIM